MPIECQTDEGIWVSCPLFSGEGLQLWLEQIESFFTLFQISAEQQVNLAYHHIFGVASTWSSKHEELIAWWSWSEFVDALRDQFDPPTSVKKSIDLMVLENGKHTNCSADLGLGSTLTEEPVCVLEASVEVTIYSNVIKSMGNTDPNYESCASVSIPMGLMSSDEYILRSSSCVIRLGRHPTFSWEHGPFLLNVSNYIDLDFIMTETAKFVRNVAKTEYPLMRHVNEVSNAKALRHQSVPTKESELATLIDSLGEHVPYYLTPEKRSASLKKHLESLLLKVEDLRTKKEERMKQFANVKAQIEKTSGEISGSSTLSNYTNVEENDLSIRKLNEYQTSLQSLNKEKSDRVKKILESVNEVYCLCGVMGVDFGKTVSKVHPSYASDFDEVSYNNELHALVLCSLLILRGGTWHWKSVSTTSELQSQILPPKSVPGCPPWSYYPVKDVDLVVSAAGPFQRAEKCTVLEAAIFTKTTYMIVCDDADYFIQAKTFQEKASAANIPAITTAGIYLGVSNLMVAELVRSTKDENMDVVAYSKGEEIKLKPYSRKVIIDFGKGFGKIRCLFAELP